MEMIRPMTDFLPRSRSRAQGRCPSAAGRVSTTHYVLTRKGVDPKPYNAATLALQPRFGEKLSWDFNPMFQSPDFQVALESEKPIRGRLTDARTGKPRPGVVVYAEQDDGISRHGHKGTTDADGRHCIVAARWTER